MAEDFLNEKPQREIGGGDIERFAVMVSDFRNVTGYRIHSLLITNSGVVIEHECRTIYGTRTKFGDGK